MPTTATGESKELARRLLADEAASGKATDATDSAGFRVCDKIRAPLAKLIGVVGADAVLSRALALAGAEVTWLRGLDIETYGAPENLDQLKAKHDSRTLADGERAVVSELLGLLVVFLGSAMTLQLVQDIWPKIDDARL